MTHRLQTSRRIIALADLGLALAGTVLLAAGSYLYRSQPSAMGTAVSYCIIPCALLAYAWTRGRTAGLLQPALITGVAGLILLIDVFVAALSAGYSNPCFEVAPCTKSPTIAYIAETAAAFVFLGAAFASIILFPAISAVEGFRNRQHEHQAP